MHIVNKAKDLLKKFQSGNLSLSDFKELVSTVNDSSDQELEDVLFEEWNKFDTWNSGFLNQKFETYYKLDKKEIDLYKICNQLYETKNLIDKGIIASSKYDYDECCSYVYGFNTRKAIDLIKKHIQDLGVTIIQITLDKEQVYSVQNLTEVLENAKEQIKVRNELIKEYQEEEKKYRKGLVKKVIHIQSEKDFRNQEISRYKRKLKEYEESSIER